MRYRQLGRTGLEVSEVGFGAWGIGGGWGSTSDDESVRALHRAIDRGVTFIDTAHGYGHGHSERIVGSVVRERQERIVVATKVPPANRRWPADPDTPIDEAMPEGYLTRITLESLERLGMERVDVQQLHVWAERWLHEGSWLDELAQLKRDGRIGAFGISINDHQPDTALEVVASGLIDTVQVIYNIFDQSPQDALLDLCAEHGVGVIVRVPFDEGGLTGRIDGGTVFEPTDWRRRYFRDGRAAEVSDRVDAIVRDLDVARERIAEIALRFVLSHPAVSTVIPGMRRVQNVDRNIDAADAGPLDPAQLDVLARHRWIRDFYR